jgi:4-amino-4-deoxy-L-arabinose transferase-like glycosyltransferase
VRPALVALLAATAVLYLWGLGASGWANSFYSAAVEAGTKSWKAFFYGSFDSSNFITVDKPPASLWVMELSARVFGVNAWSILVPQALEGVAAVGLLYATVRRRFSPGAALLAGACLAVTPVATLMFRFDNPDALLTLLLVGSAYAMVRALERARTRWLVVAGALVGFAFLTKMLQALLVVPGFATVYLATAPATLRRRLGQLAAAGVAMVAAAGWWVAAVASTPASARPYVGGSQHDSILELTFGYNGFGRLTGDETGSVGGGGIGGASRWGATGITRLFGADMGGQVAWLIPAALVFLAATCWLSRRAPRTDGRRAQVLLWGSWLVVTGLTFSYAKGIVHPYYTVALAPAVAALAGIGAATFWRHRDVPVMRAVLAIAVAVTAIESYALLSRTPAWHPALRAVVLVAGLGAALALTVGARLRRAAAVAVAGVALLASLAGPAAYAVDTAATPHTGAIPSAGPAVSGQFGPGRGGFPGGGPGPLAGRPSFGGTTPFGGAGPAQVPRGGTGGLLDAQAPNAALAALLRQDSSSYTWVAATVGANNAAGLQLGTDEPVMAIGGFNGTDPAPSLAEFQRLVEQGAVHYFVAAGTGAGGPGGGGGTSAQITSWVEQTFAATTVGGTTVVDLTSAQVASSADTNT